MNTYAGSRKLLPVVFFFMSAPTLPTLDFELLFSLLPGPHGVLGSDGTVLSLNAAMAGLLPVGAASGLLGQPLAALLAAAEAAGVVLPTAEAWASGLAAARTGAAQTLPPARPPATAPTPRSYWQAVLRPVPPGQPQHLLVQLLDAEPLLHQQATEQAEQERGQLLFLAETIPQLIWATDARGETEYTNQQFIDYTGHNVLGMDAAARQALWGRIIHPDDLLALNARWDRARQLEQGFDAEFRLRNTAGEYRWFFSHVVPQLGPHGEVRRWLGACTDADAPHRTQLHPGSEQLRMQRIFDLLPLTITTMEGPDHRFTFLSAQAQKKMGPRVAVGRTMAECLPEIAAQGYGQLLQQVLDSGQPVFGHEERSQLLDPNTGAINEHYNNFGYLPLVGEAGALAGVLAYSLDVTEQVRARQQAETLRFQAQASAQAADQRLRHITESQPSITFISDQHGAIGYISPQWYAYTGSNPTDSVDEVWQQRLHPEDRPRVEAAYATARATGSAWHYEFRLRRHDGQYRWFTSQGVPEPLTDAQAAGRPRQWYGTNLDIHELREAQRQLELKDQQLSQILRQTPAMIATLEGPDHRFTFSNPGFDALVAHRVHLGQPAAECFSEATEQGFIGLLDHVYRTGETFVGREMPVTLQLPDTGQEQLSYLDFTYQALRNNQNEITGILAFAVDVTQQVQARREAHALQAEVQAADTRLRQQAEALPIITFTTDSEGRTTYMSPQWYAFTGQPTGGPLAEVDTAWADRVHPDDRERTAQEIEQSIAGPRLGRVEVRLRSHNGEYRWFLTEAVPELDAAGRLLHRYGYMLDVQDLRERTHELARSREDFASLADNMAQLAWIADPTGHIFWYNQQWYDYTGATPEAVMGWGWTRVHDPAQRAGMQERYLASIRTGQPWEDTFPLRRHDGEFRWFLSRARPVRDPATGAVLRWFGTNTDVTELRQLQQQLTAGEEELRIQAESIPQQVWTAQSDGTVDFYNQRMAAYLGEPMEKNGAAYWLRFVHPDDHAPLQARWQAATATQRYFEAEFRLRRYDGEYRWFLSQAQARRAPGGQVLKWYGTNTDVHQQRTLQEQVRASQARFEQLLEALPQMTWTALPNGDVSYYSQRWYDYSGGSFEKLQDCGWEQLVHPDDLTDTIGKWRHSLATGEPFEDETRWRSRTGEYRWFLVRAEAIRDSTGAVAQWVGAHTDVHDFKQVQQQLEAQNARLLRSNDDLDNFMYTASHDLKQPINNMAGIFEELTRTAYFRDPDAIKLIAYFERALDQIFTTIDHLGAIVQGQREQQEVPAEDVALGPLVAEVIASLQDQVRQTGAVFELDFTTYPVLSFVRPNLQSLFFNLISNSLKYAAPGRPPRICLSSTPDVTTGRSILTVQDNGLGIDMARFGPQLFQLFRRFHTHVEGTGMGLYLVNRIVQGHGGRLEVASTVGEGTTFRIHL